MNVIIENLKKLLSYCCFLLCVLNGSVIASPSSLPLATFNNVKDFTYSYWENGYENANNNLHIETSDYVVSFDAEYLQLNYIIPVDARGEYQAFKSPFQPISPPVQTANFYLKQNGQTYALDSLAGNIKNNSRLVEGGKFYQRRIFTPVEWQSNTPAITETDVELQTWPDRMSLLLRVTPAQDIINAELGVDIDLALSDPNIETAAAHLIGLNDVNQSFVIENTNTAATFSYQPDTNKIHLQLNKSTFLAGEETTISFSIYPKRRAAAAEHYQAVQHQTSQPLTVTAQRKVDSQLEGNPPFIEDIASYYDKELGAIVLEMPTLVKDTLWSNRVELNELLERVTISFNNNSDKEQLVRILLKGDNEPEWRPALVGFTANFTDSDNSPVGIPLQISKNWHGAELNRGEQRYNAKWVHLFSMITVPAKTTTVLKLASAKGHYGGTASAVHQQLSLIGWGSNQLWDISTLGSWGESICYAPDQAQRGNSILDVRPVYSISKKGAKWVFGRNAGGGDFLRYYPKDQLDNNNPLKIPHGNIRAYNKRVSPVMTEVLYGGSLEDNSIDLEYSTSIYRTDDIVRGVYHFRYDIQQNINFDRFVLFQVGADNYNENNDKKFAYGNETGLVEEWNTQIGGNVNRTSVKALTGESPWISLHEPKSSKGFSTRGIIIREYKAVINGQPQTIPHFVERGSVAKGKDIVIADLVLPEGTESLKTGDYIEATVEYTVFPGSADAYYGVNSAFKAALTADQNTWKMVHRDAVLNSVDVTLTKGELIRNRPIFINADNNQAQFTLTNGLGYVPFTIGNLSDFKTPVLQQKTGDTWVDVDQSVHGKDFWQTDYNPDSNKWEITYSIPILDALPDGDTAIEFAFKLTNSDGSTKETPSTIITVADALTTTANNALSSDLLSNDIDPEQLKNDATIVLVTQPHQGVAEIKIESNQVTYTPQLDYVGEDQFTYSIIDSQGRTSNTATVMITVNAEAIPPVAENDNVELMENTSTTIEILNNDLTKSYDIAPTSVTIIQKTSNGTVVTNNNGSILYTPTTGYAGTDEFTYTVTDTANLVSNVATVKITVNKASTEEPAPSSESSGGSTNVIFLLYLSCLLRIRKQLKLTT